MARGRINALMIKRLLCFADVLRGELGPDEPPKVVRLDTAQAGRLRIVAHNLPDGLG